MSLRRLALIIVTLEWLSDFVGNSEIREKIARRLAQNIAGLDVFAAAKRREDYRASADFFKGRGCRGNSPDNADWHELIRLRDATRERLHAIRANTPLAESMDGASVHTRLQKGCGRIRELSGHRVGFD